MFLNSTIISAAFIFFAVVIPGGIASSFPAQIGSDIDGEAAYDGSLSGLSLSSDGSTVAIGAVLNDGNNGVITDSGHVRVFEVSGNLWIQKGGDIDGAGVDD
mmetsp:Transcript_13572/g.22635  ORF Transcript_13572/g.22635 Transcript_13572/m.22635 type:complete len:102 (+) Transcript_13572:83-388(+)